MKVLLVDEDAVSRVLTQRTLERSGFDVMSASNGNDALELLLACEGPCIALLDPSTPGGEGLNLCREVRASANNHSVYIILMTARDAVDDVVKGNRHEALAGRLGASLGRGDDQQQKTQQPAHGAGRFRGENHAMRQSARPAPLGRPPQDRDVASDKAGRRRQTRASHPECRVIPAGGTLAESTAATPAARAQHCQSGLIPLLTRAAPGRRRAWSTA